MAGTLRVFMFHDVRDLDETIFPKRYELRSFLRKKSFLNQIDYIKANYKIIKSTDIIDLDLRKTNDDYAVLTFDDGLVDHYWVFNELNKQNVPATFCIPAAPILNSHIIDSHAIQFIIASTDEHRLVKYLLEFFDINSRASIWEEYSRTRWSNSWWSKEMIFITNLLRSKSYSSIMEVFKKFVSKDIELFAKKLYLSFEQVEHIADNYLMTIAGHGNSSTNMTKTPNVDGEINAMTRFLELFTDDRILSYPNGGYYDYIKKTLTDNGYTLGFTTIPKTLTDLDEYDLMAFPRYDAPQKLPL